MRRKALFTVLILLMSFLPASAFAEEMAGGKITGHVFNATNNVDVADQEVVLEIYINGSQADSKLGRTDAKGQFVFEGLSTSQAYTYDVKITYQEADYATEQVNYGDGSALKPFEIKVYDSTKDVSIVKVDSAHTLIYPKQDGLLIKTYLMVNNPTNLTYVGSKQLAPDKKETLRFDLPAGAQQPTYELDLMQCCVIPGDAGFSDTMPVFPGSKQIGYSYLIPYSSTEYTLTQKFDYPIDLFDVLIPPGTMNVSSDKLVALGSVAIDTEQYDRYSISNLTAGDAVNIQLSGLPGKKRQTVVWALSGLGIIGFVAGFILVSRKRKIQPAPVPAVVATTPQLKQQLLLEIARLDDSFEAGRIPEELYRRERAEKKDRLLRLMRKILSEGNP